MNVVPWRSRFNNNKTLFLHKLKNGSCYANKHTTKKIQEIVNVASKKRSESEILKRYAAIIHKEGIENIESIRNDIVNNAKDQDPKALHTNLVLFQLACSQAAKTLLDEMVQEELHKKKRNKDIIKFAIQQYSNIGKNTGSEIRKLSENLHEFQHGKLKKVISAKVDINEFLADGQKPINPLIQGKKDENTTKE